VNGLSDDRYDVAARRGWGVEDELGAANELSDATVVEADGYTT